MSHDTPIRLSRTPSGSATEKQVVIRIPVEEYEDLRVKAHKDSRSISSLARIYYFEGKKSSCI